MATFQTVSIENIPSYSSSNTNPKSSSNHLDARFLIDHALNEKLSLFRGAAYAVEADALLLSTNESFSERAGVTGEVWKLLGKVRSEGR